MCSHLLCQLIFIRFSLEGMSLLRAQKTNCKNVHTINLLWSIGICYMYSSNILVVDTLKAYEAY